MNTSTQKTGHSSAITDFLPKKNFLFLLSCIHIDSFFLHAIAFGLLLTISRVQNQDSLTNQKVKTQRGLRMTLQLQPRPQKNQMALRSGIFIGGISVTYKKDFLSPKGIAYTAEAA